MKEYSKCLIPRKACLNQTYSIDEIAIDVNRPIIGDTNDNYSRKEINDLTASPLNFTRRERNKQQQVFVEQSKVTITKHTISTKSTEIKTVKSSNTRDLDDNSELPKIIITDWDQGISQPKNVLIEKAKETISSDEDSIEINKQVSPKIVEEKTIDQFQEMDLLDHSNQSTVCELTPKSTNRSKESQSTRHKNEMRIETMSLGSEIRCKCCNKSTSSSYCSRGSYIIVKNTQPANIQVELFESRFDASIESTNKLDINKPNPLFESTNYYLVNNKMDEVTDNQNNQNNNIDINNNNEANFHNKNLEISQNIFENDEYHLCNFKKPNEPNQSNHDDNNDKDNEGTKLGANFLPEDFEKVERQKSKKDHIDQFKSLNLSTYLSTGHICCSRSSHSSHDYNKVGDNDKDLSPISSKQDDENVIKVVELVGKKLDQINLESPANYLSASHIRSDNETSASDKIEPENKQNHTDYFYLYVSGDRCNEIFTKGRICLEKIFHNGKVIDAILLLTLPPGSSDHDLLYELYGPNVPFDKFRVQCYIKLNRGIFEKNSKYLIKIDESKYLCTKRIEFGSKFPKHEFRFRFNKD